METLPRRVRVGSALVALLAALGAGILSAPGAWASVSAEGEAPVTWSVRPADAAAADGRSWVEQEAEPGSVATEHLAVRNLGETDVTFAVTAADGYFTPAGRFTMLASDRESVDAGTWIDVAPTIAVAAGQTAIVPFTITVPMDATPGDHAAGIAASIFSEGTDAGAKVAVESRVGFRVMVRVDGEVQPSLGVEGSGAYLTAWNPLAPGDVVLAYDLENSGNVRLEVATGTEWGGAAIADDGEGAAPTELLPGDRRTAQLRVPDVWPLGLIALPLVVEQSIVMPDGTLLRMDAVEQTVWIWAIPWPQLVCVVALGLVALGLLWGRRRRAAELERLVADARAQGRREAQRGM
ncbi:hypothetical protein [Microbacterium sp. 2FI]|uniref:hypothetical protein n=1 Tax=Microbacterium sp. 2FI TaxID=2502193 RepID=UPI0010F55690|nr:hypothetical protein [Microbacterium sp. 2FI]